jgi:hypothetical protein
LVQEYRKARHARSSPISMEFERGKAIIRINLSDFQERQV